jgi:hypothetical protein
MKADNESKLRTDAKSAMKANGESKSRINTGIL